MSIATVKEAKRGCGYRSPGGLYLMGGILGEPCHQLPFLLTVCPTCGHGIRPARAWTWINGAELFAPGCTVPTNPKHCPRCVMCTPSLLVPTNELKESEEQANRGMSGLIWVGEKFYPTVDSFMDEGLRMDISRRITTIPRGFVLGETWVFLAHKNASAELGDTKVIYHAGIFQVYKPTSIDYVVKDDETEEELVAMEKRGITPIKVEHNGVTEDIVV